MQITRAPGVRLEALGAGWVAFSGVSGDTHQLNNEAAAVLEWLAPGPMDESELCAVVAADTGLDAAEIHATLRDVWSSLEMAGLIRTAADHNFG